VPESLLLRSDLSPEIIQNEQTLYGVKLDLSLVESSRATNEVELQNEMLFIDRELEQLDNTLKKLEFTSNQLNKQTKSFESDILSTESKYKQHKKNIEDVQEELRQLELRIDQALENRKNELKSKQKIINKQVNNEQSRIEKSRQAYNMLKQYINSEYKEKYDALAIHLEEKQNKLEMSKQISKEEIVSDIKELDTQKKLALIENGVNPNYLESLTKDLEEKEKLLNKARKSEELVEKYYRWLNNNWSEYDFLQSRSKAVNESLNEVIEQWKIQKSDLEQEEKNLQGKLNKITTEYNQIQSEVVLLQRVLEQYPDKGSESPENTSNILLPSSPSILENKWLQVSKKEKETAKKAGALYATICRAINTYRDSTPQRFLERMSSDISSEYTHIRDEWIFAEEKLADYMRQGHQDHLQMLQSDAQLMGSQISDYFTVLERTHKQINSLGTDVSGHAQEVIKGFPAISDLSVTVLSSLDKLDFWNALQNFSASHQSWRARSTALNALPDDEYIENLSLVSTLIEKSGISRQLERSFDISFSITDQGKTKTARTSKELKDISSNGLAYLILISIYIALVNMLRGSSGVVMIWPVDELRNFSAANAVKLMALL
jgi:chromosome segregation ATPase